MLLENIPVDADKLIDTEDGLLVETFPAYTRAQLRQWKKEAKMVRKKLKKEFELDRAAVEARKQARFSEEKYAHALDEIQRLQRENSALLQLKQTPQEIQIKGSTKASSEATALMIASDWHIEELVRSETVSNLNSFDLRIAESRAKNFFANGLKLTRMCSKDVKINTLVLALLGDFISGTIHEELAENNQLMPADAAWTVQNWLISGINYLLDNSDYTLQIPCSSGNHGRITKRIHYSTEQGNSLENFMYHNLALYYRSNKRVHFSIAEGYHLRMNIYDTRVRFHHGHAIKYQGGVGGIYIPVNKAIAQWNKGSNADLDVFGHFHQQRDGGNFICNGSLIGYNTYAVSIKADFEKPKQSFFLIDKMRGKTIVAPIDL